MNIYSYPIPYPWISSYPMDILLPHITLFSPYTLFTHLLEQEGCLITLKHMRRARLAHNPL